MHPIEPAWLFIFEYSRREVFKKSESAQVFVYFVCRQFYFVLTICSSVLIKYVKKGVGKAYKKEKKEKNFFQTDR